jgi:uncharacterized protein (DUF1697 family)
MVDVNKFVALLRGINVGTAKRIPMAQLREVFSALGLRDVRTHLQSGNVVFAAPFRPDVVMLEAAVLSATGVQSSIVLLDEAVFRDIHRQNPFGDVPDPSRMLVHFTDAMPAAAALDMPDPAEFAPEQLAVGDHALYQWAPDGLLATKVPARFYRQFPGVLTTRNLRTVDRILLLLDEGSDG